MAPTDKPCCLGTVKQGELKGKNVTLGPLTTYVTGDASPGAQAILAIPDIYGFGIPNTRLFADQLAAKGFLVLLPNIFHNDAWPEDRDWAEFPAWIEKHHIEAEMLQINRLLTDVHQIYQPKSIGCVGFCWGGRHCVKLASTDKVYAAAVAHGSRIEAEEVEAVNQPIFFLYADEDPQIPADKRKLFESILQKKSSVTKGKFYPGSHHGFVIRGDESDPKQAEHAADAFAEIAAFFKEQQQSV